LFDTLLYGRITAARLIGLDYRRPRVWMFARDDMVGVFSVRWESQVHILIRSLTDMAAAGPELFSPVPKLQRGWCFLGRYVAFCGIPMLVLVVNHRLMCAVARRIMFAFQEFQLRLCAAAWTIGARLSWRLCHTAF
jgi:hypothetical protein